MSYSFRYGLSDAILHAADKFVLRNFAQYFHKIEFRGDHLVARVYRTSTDAGQSYNLGALGLLVNEQIQPTRNWATEYATQYLLTIQGHIEGIRGGDKSLAHKEARRYADREHPEEGSERLNQIIAEVKQRDTTEGGARFKDDSKLYHVDVSYDLKHLLNLDIKIGGSGRVYDFFSQGTIFNEAPEDGTNYQRIRSIEGGLYLQIKQRLLQNRLNIAASIRGDKKDEFATRLTPRIALSYGLAPRHFIRASYQTAFRNPDAQSQFLYFLTGDGIILGSAKSNAERYNIHNGGAYSTDSYQSYLASGGILHPDGRLEGGDISLLERVNIPFVEKEQLESIEIGYRGVWIKRFFLDISGYYNQYRDFIVPLTVISSSATTHQGDDVPAGERFRPFANAKDIVTAHGIGAQMNYRVWRNVWLDGNYNYANFNEFSGIQVGFNTPKHRISMGMSVERLWRHLGGSFSYRWQDSFEWQSSFGTWEVPELWHIECAGALSFSRMAYVAKNRRNESGGQGLSLLLWQFFYRKPVLYFPYL